MGLFKTKPKVPAYTAPTGDIVLTRQQFVNMMKTRPVFREYSRVVGLVPAGQALTDAYTESLRSMAANGYWAYGTSANFGAPTQLKFQGPQQLETFFDVAIELLFRLDLTKIDQRTRYLQGLLGKADSGLLWQELQNNHEPEANYFTPPVPRAARGGAPVVPPRSGDLAEQPKALGWLTSGVHGDASAFTNVLLELRRSDGSFPLGADSSLLMNAWRRIVPIAPAYRGWNNTASQQKYPSNVGGVKVVDDMFRDLSVRATPPRGDTAWYDLALYVFGGIVTAQAFTDGNKRTARLGYVLMLLSGGVPMVAPNNAFGARLGDMM